MKERKEGLIPDRWKIAIEFVLRATRNSPFEYLPSFLSFSNKWNVRPSVVIIVFPFFQLSLEKEELMDRKGWAVAKEWWKRRKREIIIIWLWLFSFDGFKGRDLKENYVCCLSFWANDNLERERKRIGFIMTYYYTRQLLLYLILCCKGVGREEQ